MPTPARQNFPSSPPAACSPLSRSYPKTFKSSTFIDIIPIDLAWPWPWSANDFEKTGSLPQMCVCVGCELNSDPALRFLCLKGHVRTRGLTLWRHQLTRSERIFVKKCDTHTPCVHHDNIFSRVPIESRDHARVLGALESVEFVHLCDMTHSCRIHHLIIICVRSVEHKLCTDIVHTHFHIDWPWTGIDWSDCHGSELRQRVWGRQPVGEMFAW